MDTNISTVAEYVRNTDEARARVAADYGTKPGVAKKLFNRITFGGGIARWKSDFNVGAQARSEDAERFEKQMQRARVVVAARERSRGAARETKDKTLVSKAVGRAEEAWIRRLSEKLEAAGWRTGSLIRDAIIVSKENEQRKTKEHKMEIERIVRTVLDEEVEKRGWGRGLIRAKVTKT